MESSNQIKSALRDWMAERFSPTAIVFSSSGVRDILDKQSSLSPAELLRPFANVGDLNNISLQTCEKNQPFRLSNFRINFVDSHKLDRQSHFDNSFLTDIIIQNSTPKKFQDISSSSIQKDTDAQLKRKLTSLLDYHKYEALTPWFFKWKRQFLQQTMFSDHELLTQPIAFIYFISATEANPLSALDILKRADNLPSMYKEGLYDDTIHAVQNFVFVLNPTGSSKAFQDCQDTVMQKHHLSTIFEISMTNQPKEGQPPLDDLWTRLVDLDEQGLMKELQIESHLRGRSFSDPDRLKISQVLKKVIEKQMLPFIEKRIRSLETNIANTRKGIKNQFKSLWKKQERGENDGLKETFKMNKEELELRNLVDLAFVAQDYETATKNGGIPLSDFKKCKAYRHAASCQEIIGLAQIAFETSQNQMTSFKEIESMMEAAYSLYTKAGKIQFILRCGIYMYELYEKLERHAEASNILIRLINEVKDNSVIVPLFQEQVALKQLQMKNFRKFALYMIMAGKSYEKLNQKNYSFNCFTTVHPFYQRYGKGWNGIRFQLYSSLGRHSQSLGDINLAVQFFRNLLQLCCEFDNQNEQKSCLNEFLIAIQNWNGQKSMVIGLEGEEGQQTEQKQAHIGQLNLPVILEESIDIYLSSEKLYTNRPESLINNLYFAHPTSVTSNDENQDYVIQQKAELNTNNCPWKYLAKHLFELMNDERRNNGADLVQEACQFNQEELNEFGVYDCTSRLRKRDLTIKKVRKAFVGESIVVKLLMRNPLMADIYLNNIKLVCRYDSPEPTSKEDYEQLDRNIILRSLETKEIILEIFPKRAGKFIIERIEWVLFDVVSCAYQMVKPIDKDRKLLTQEELQVSKKLLDRENNFIYDVLERSGEANAKIILTDQPHDQGNTFIFTEVQKAQLQIVNESYKYELKNGYVVCSHPMIFGFSRMRLFDKIEKGGKFTLPLNMRASLMHKNEIKFLIRYEVCNQEEGGAEGVVPQVEKMSRFRFCRLVFNLESLYAFTPKRHVHLSTKQANEHIFNIQIVDNVQPGTSVYQTPQIQAIEIINRKKLWSLRRKDDKGQFFVIIPTANQTDSEQSIIVYQDSPLEGVVSIFDSPEKTNYFNQEQAFVVSKFKMQPTNEEEEVDIVIQWAIPGLKKRGFYCLFKIPLLKMHKQLTEQQKKLQRNAHKVKETSLIQRINPLHLAYTYNKTVTHDFSQNKPAIVTFSLTLSNMIQTQDFSLNCKVEGVNEWSQLNNPTDVSESNGFLWIGKTKYIVRHLKPNEIKRVELKCAILKPGVYNMNRLCVTILDPSEIGEEETNKKTHHFVREIRLPDDILLTAIDTSKPDLFDNNPSNGEQNLISFD